MSVSGGRGAAGAWPSVGLKDPTGVGAGCVEALTTTTSETWLAAPCLRSGDGYFIVGFLQIVGAEMIGGKLWEICSGLRQLRDFILSGQRHDFNIGQNNEGPAPVPCKICLMPHHRLATSNVGRTLRLPPYICPRLRSPDPRPYAAEAPRQDTTPRRRSGAGQAHSRLPAVLSCR